MIAAFITGIFNIIMIMTVLMLSFYVLIWFRTTIFEYLLTMGDDIVYSKDCGFWEEFFPTFYKWFK